MEQKPVFPKVICLEHKMGGDGYHQGVSFQMDLLWTHRDEDLALQTKKRKKTWNKIKSSHITSYLYILCCFTWFLFYSNSLAVSTQVTCSKLTLQVCRAIENTAQFLLSVPCRTCICPLYWLHVLVGEERLRAEPVPDEKDQTSSCPISADASWQGPSQEAFFSQFAKEDAI